MYHRRKATGPWMQCVRAERRLVQWRRAEAGGGLETRRKTENLNAGYNRMFETSDASLCGNEDIDMADTAKYVGMLSRFKDALSELKAVNVYGSAGGNVCDALRIVEPQCTIVCHHLTDTKDNKYPFKPWQMSDGYVGDGLFLADMSYGEATKVEENNRLKVEMLRKSRYLCGFIKFTLTSNSNLGVNADGSNSLPYGIEDILDMYDKVQLCAPGKLHSPEFYVLFFGRRSVLKCGTKVKDSQVLTGMLQMKSMMMAMANDLRSVMWDSCFPLGFGSHVADVGGPLVRDCLSAITYSRTDVLDSLALRDVIKMPDRTKQIGADQDEALDRLSEFYSNRALFEARSSAQSEIPAIIGASGQSLTAMAAEVPDAPHWPANLALDREHAMHVETATTGAKRLRPSGFDSDKKIRE